MERLQRLRIPLRPHELEALRQLAEREERDLVQQARLLIRRGLLAEGLLEEWRSSEAMGGNDHGPRW